MTDPSSLTERPVVRGAPVPFACLDDEGRGRHEHVVKARALQCALSRICGICGRTLSRPLAFVGTVDEALDGEFLFPACHVACVRETVADPRQLLGHPVSPDRWLLVTTGGFDVRRPDRRGGPVHFRPNSVLERETLDLHESLWRGV
mgnify:CR=1 FL=1